MGHYAEDYEHADKNGEKSKLKAVLKTQRALNSFRDTLTLDDFPSRFGDNLEDISNWLEIQELRIRSALKAYGE